MNIKPLLVLLLLSGIYSAALTISGDAGEQWSKDKAQEMCTRSDIASVYICLGNVVDVVWEDTSKGSTFYKPDGGIIECPPLAASERNAVCIQLMMPNYCTLDDNICGERPPEEFPGGQTEEQNNESTVQQPPAEQNETPTVEPTPHITARNKTNDSGNGLVLIQPNLSGGIKNNSEAGPSAIDILTIIIVVLAVAAILSLYFIFKRTTGR